MGKGLEIREDLTFQYRHWQRERAGWIGIACILAAALLGMFGHHPFSRMTTQTENRSLVIAYDRYGRAESSAGMTITVTPEKQEEGTTRIWFNAEYLDAVRVVSLSPMPLRGEARDGGRAFVIQTDGRPFTIMLSVQFRTFGVIQGQVKINEDAPLSFTHFVWP